MAVTGYVLLWGALLASVYSAIAYQIGTRKKLSRLVVSANDGLVAAFLFISASVAVLLFAILTHNFQIEYVASYTSRDTSFFYLLSGLWAGNAGSLLFWAWLISLFATIFLLRKKDINEELLPHASSVIMLVQAFFLILLLAVSNPFRTLQVAPPDGRGLNPMLENIGMILHPPALLAGYVGFTIPFALVIAALLTRQFSGTWLSEARKWALLSWLLLGVGNIIGAWWAYVELGWGGYWAWDPVENAGLMPWLTATAFLHSNVMQSRKGVMKTWNLSLIVLTFLLAIFGTFLTRSGVLSSVHTFGESRLGPFFLVFLGIAFLISFGLIYYYKDELKARMQTQSFVSKEFAFQLATWLLVGATLIILVGTIFPALSEAVRGVKIVVEESFFNRVNGPIFLVLVLLAGICIAISWRQDSALNLLRRFFWPFLATVLFVVILIAAIDVIWYVTIFLSLCFLTFLIILKEWGREVRARHRSSSENYARAFWKLLQGNRPHFGAYIVHLSIAFIAAGVIGSSFLAMEKEIELQQGESITIKNYTLTYEDLAYSETASKQIVTATISAQHNQNFIGVLKPEKYFHRNYEQPVTEVAIRSSPLEDLYVILAGWDTNGTAAFKVLVNPMVIWIWVGGGLLALGGVVAYWPTRKRQRMTTRTGVVSEPERDIETEIEKKVLELRRKRSFLCPNCGGKYQENSRFCSQCGAKLRGD
ncbi:MAG: cytochrome c-type biogenesis CcmF C-terminal domain-containing protein [Chloroflexota bacterium]|nr:cytochrome c biogenesis protein CcsA [Chloroflexota bacterium]